MADVFGRGDRLLQCLGWCWSNNERESTEAEDEKTGELEGLCSAGQGKAEQEG